MFTKQRFIKSALVLALLSTGTVASAATTVKGGTVHFTGQIVNAACAVSADSTNQTVNLGQYRTAKFDKVGAYSDPVPFNIKLEDCDTTVSTTAQVQFYGGVTSADATLLSVSNISGGAAGSASGVGIEISDGKGKILTPGTTWSTAQNLFAGANTLPFSARYKSTSATVTAGEADADATFEMQYN